MMRVMDRINTDMLFRITAALCLSSVTDGTARVSLALGAIVTVTAVLTAAVVLLLSYFASQVTAKLCGAVLGVSSGVSLAAVAVSFFGLASLSAGVFTAAAVSASLMLGVYTEKEYSIIDSLFGCAVFTASLTAAGMLREVFGGGTLFGSSVGFPEKFTVGVLDSPAGGMIVCAVIAALMRCILTSGKEGDR